MCCAVSEVIPLREVASVFWIALLLDRKVEVCLADIILSVNFFLCEASSDYTKEAGVVYL
jgi:hypothetical protein